MMREADHFCRPARLGAGGSRSFRPPSRSCDRSMDAAMASTKIESKQATSPRLPALRALQSWCAQADGHFYAPVTNEPVTANHHARSTRVPACVALTGEDARRAGVRAGMPHNSPQSLRVRCGTVSRGRGDHSADAACAGPKLRHRDVVGSHHSRRFAGLATVRGQAFLKDIEPLSNQRRTRR